MRSLKEIKADPQATPAEMSWLWSQDLVATVQHPNCPVESWWRCALVYPVEARASVLFPLFTLEEPGRWAALEANMFVQEKILAHWEAQLDSVARQIYQEAKDAKFNELTAQDPTNQNGLLDRKKKWIAWSFAYMQANAPK